MSYMDLLNAWRKEMHEIDLQVLSPSFYKDMGDYMMKLREETRMLERGTTRSRVAEKERENVEKMIDDLFKLRLRKIISAEASGKEIEVGRLTIEERHFLLEMKKILSEHQESLKSILRGQAPEVKVKPKAETGFKVIRVLEHIPAIIGIDMKTYGPFKPEEVATIPAENAENLIRRSLAVKVEEEEST
jgi:DNA replication factor GINS